MSGATVIDFEAEKKKREENARLRREKESQLMKAAEIFADSFEAVNGGKPFEEFSWIRLGNLYAVASICYYKHDYSPMADEVFDALCLYLLQNLETALENRAGGLGTKKFLREEMLSAGSGYDMSLFDNYLLDLSMYVEMVMRRRG